MTAWLLVAPAVLAIVVLFIIPIGYVLVLSVTDPTISLEHYRRIFTVPLYGSVMLNTFKTSLIVTIACLLLGYPLAYVMARRNDWVAIVLPGRGRHELLDRLCGANLCLAGDPRQQGAGVRPLRFRRVGPAAATPVHVVQFDIGHDPHPPALHGARALRRHAQDRSLLYAGRRGPGRAAVRRVPPCVPAAEPAGRRQRLRRWSLRCASASTSRRSCSARRRT